ncbi:flagellar hook protein FlgE [Amaricoccus solimangrovi]|uniref:Flagellar hook protein FlgE n=1 Tax=Amaricoccus solimangrovi TaxID=2589815 RepID=A0A501WY35_9RHOB|nr:flagellar hook-basal body complex protein [Amaricoccus solimangrovi]TPE53652.1 flagellar hook-basal body complex protein [Amaricoccus solimangrovi]
MGISSSMNAGVSGLNANANKLSTISDNIANAQTNGYKRADVDFYALTVGSGSGGGYSAGGVTTSAIIDIEGKGSITGTTNATDMAVAGRGLLPVTSLASVEPGAGVRDLRLTSTGSFALDADGYLTTSSGLVLLGWAADGSGKVPEVARDTVAPLTPVRVNLAGAASQPTSSITLGANLPATATMAGADGAAKTVTVEYFDNLGTSRSLSMQFTPTVPASGASNAWTLEITDQATGLPAGTYELTFGAASGNAGNLASVAMVSAGSAPPSTSYDAASGTMTLDLGDQTIAMGLGSTDPAGPRYLTQLSSGFSTSGITKDGSAAGTFTGLTIDEKGMLSANYSTGFTRVLYQVPVADVPNLNGLRVLGGQTFGVSAESGPVFFYDAGSGPAGAIEGFALEQSTADTAAELTQLIQTQRAYSSNAKVIQTVDEMMQETTNLKR